MLSKIYLTVYLTIFKVYYTYAVHRSVLNNLILNNLRVKKIFYIGFLCLIIFLYEFYNFQLMQTARQLFVLKHSFTAEKLLNTTILNITS